MSTDSNYNILKVDKTKVAANYIIQIIAYNEP